MGNKGLPGQGLPLRISTGKPGYRGEIPPESVNPRRFQAAEGVDAALLGGIELGHHHLDVLQLLAQEWRLASMSWIME